MRELPFTYTRSSQQITVRGMCRLTRGQVRIELLDASGHPIGDPFVLVGSQDEEWTFVGSDFPAGHAYRLRCTPRDAAGRYRVTVVQEYGVTFIQRIGLLCLLLPVLLVVLGGLRLVGIGRDTLRKPIRVLALSTSILILSLLYPILHEGGHLAALAAWGAWEPSGTDLIGITGHPHVQGKASAQITPLKIAIAAIAGPMLPTLLGYGLFALWTSRLGRRWREKRLWLDALWSIWTMLLLFPQAAGTPFMIGSPDTDYLGFVRNNGLPLWLSNSLLVVVAIVNAVLIVVMARHLVLRVRGARRAGAPPVPQELPPA